MSSQHKFSTYYRHVNSMLTKVFTVDVTGDVHIREGSLKAAASLRVWEGARYE